MKNLITYKDVYRREAKVENASPELSQIFTDLKHRLLSGEQISELPKKVVDVAANSVTL